MLTKEEQIQLVLCGSHEDIMAYISENSLCPKAEELLVSLDNHDLIMMYISQRALCSPAEYAFIRRNKEEEIAYYTEKYQLRECSKIRLWLNKHTSKK